MEQDANDGREAGRGLPHVLVAGTGETIALVRRVLGKEAELVVGRSVAEALKLLDPGIDTVVCDLRFDDSRMFEFLQAMRDGPGASVRVIGIRTGQHELSQGMRSSITSALDALGVDLFLDLQELSARYGNEVADETLRQLILGKLVPGPEFILPLLHRRT